MLFFVALFVVPALAAFSFQLVCYMNYKSTALRTPNQRLQHA